MNPTEKLSDAELCGKMHYIAKNPTAKILAEASRRLTARNDILRAIADFKPELNDDDPYKQIAVFAKTTARKALTPTQPLVCPTCGHSIAGRHIIGCPQDPAQPEAVSDCQHITITQQETEIEGILVPLWVCVNCHAGPIMADALLRAVPSKPAQPEASEPDTQHHAGNPCVVHDGQCEPAVTAIISDFCERGSHEWCMNRDYNEAHCQCSCHIKPVAPPDSPERCAFYYGPHAGQCGVLKTEHQIASHQFKPPTASPETREPDDSKRDRLIKAIIGIIHELPSREHSTKLATELADSIIAAR